MKVFPVVSSDHSSPIAATSDHPSPVTTHNLSSNMPDSDLVPETQEDDIWGYQPRSTATSQSIIAIRQFDHPIDRPHQ